MSKLLKSKILLGVLVVVAMFAVVGFSSPSKAAADCSITTTLRVGSTGVEVSCLQTVVGATADGKFGPMTKAAVMAWQSSHGLVADGVFGPKSNAVFVAGGSVATGALCPNGMTLASNCTTAPGSTVGALCPNGMTVASNCSSIPGASVPSGTNGYLVDVLADSTGRVSTLYESETNKVVSGFRATARLADQTVDRVRVTFDNQGTGSLNLAKYITGASLWYGSTKIATMPVSQADRNTSTDVFTFNFTGLTAKIPKDQIGRFYVSVDVNGSIDTNDTAAGSNWTVSFIAYGVDAVSPDGTSDTYPATAIDVTGLSFGKFSANGVKATVNLSTNNPTAGIVSVSTTTTTNDVTLLKFTVKATNSDLTLRKVPITVQSTTANVANIVNTIKLYQGSNLIDSIDGSTLYDFDTDGNATTVVNPADTTLSDATKGVYLFSNLSDPYNKITAGSTVEFSIVADIKTEDSSSAHYTAGDSLTASFRNIDILAVAAFSVNDVNGDQLTAGGTYRIGSAVGEIQTLRVNGVQLAIGTATYATTLRGGTAVGASDIVNVEYTIPITMTAFGQTLYIPKTAAYNSDTANGVALAYGFIDSSDPSTVIASGAPATDVSAAATGPTLSSSDAATEGSAWRLDAGVPRHFTLTVVLNSSGSEAQVGTKNFAVVASELQTYTTSTVSGAGTEQTLVPVQSYQTGYKAINYGS